MHVRTYTRHFADQSQTTQPCSSPGQFTQITRVHTQIVRRMYKKRSTSAASDATLIREDFALDWSIRQPR